MELSAILTMALGICITWGGAAVCLSIAMRKRK